MSRTRTPSFLGFLAITAAHMPVQARLSHRSADVAATAAAAQAAQDAADAAQAAADAAQADADSAASAASDANTAAINAGNAATAAQTDADQALTDAAAAQSTANDASSAAGDIGDSIAATGLTLVAAPATKTGTGSADSANFSMPAVLTLTNGKQYGVEGVITARKTDGTVLMVKKIEGVRLLRSGGVFSQIAEGDERMLTSAHADIATYFSASNRRPAIGFSGANLTLDWQAENAMAFILEFDGSIADLGIATV